MGQRAIECVKILAAPIESSDYIGARDIMSALPYAGCDSVKRKLN
jgi:hypothetical protein